MLGFKEIRWESPQNDNDYSKLIQFLEAVFPCHRIIFNDRDSESEKAANISWYHEAYVQRQSIRSASTGFMN